MLFNPWPCLIDDLRPRYLFVASQKSFPLLYTRSKYHSIADGIISREREREEIHFKKENKNIYLTDDKSNLYARYDNFCCFLWRNAERRKIMVIDR